ncbi:MAG: hybrid sensor histidine kinase/response regulator [Planctomycetes bacterium]|nr:hybrid sensor histidine kinase/response regulator [Planctomycetota bacterium]
MNDFLDIFRIEAEERLERLTSGLLALEQSPDNEDLVTDLFREAHSLKGAAAVTGLEDVAAVCHRMEDVLNRMRDGQMRTEADVVDTLLAATDAVRTLVETASADHTDRDEAGQAIRRLEAVLNGGFDSGNETMSGSKPPEPDGRSTPATSAAAASESASDGTDSRPVSSHDESSNEVIATRTEAGKADEEQSPPAGIPDDHSTDGQDRTASVEMVRIRADILESLGNLTGELLTARCRLRARQRAIQSLHRLVREMTGKHRRRADAAQMQKQLEALRAVVRELQDDFTEDLRVVDPLIEMVHEQVLNARMLPLRVLFDQLPRFVRECSRHEGKTVELFVEGQETRVDRHVLEKLRDPIIHLVRNAISHGIEPAEERQASGKPATGRVRLISQRCGDRIRIVCEDDGRGIDHRQVLETALARALITDEEARRLTPDQINRLILRPGFSTASVVSDLSGRGVGMDVVARHVEELRGTLQIESEAGQFTRFVLDVPATVATLEGLLVEVSGHVYVLPTAAVVRTVRVRSSDIDHAAGGAVMFRWENQALPLLELATLLGRRPSSAGTTQAAVRPAVIVRYRGESVTLAVDRLLGTQTVVAKGLIEHVGHVPGVSGATVLGSGVPALILEPSELIERHDGRATQLAPCDSEPRQTTIAPVLIVDDSLTTRMMEKAILESAGYEVDVAANGEEAFRKLVQHNYSLVITDVEMPGWDGFELTRRLRAHPRLAELPVIIVTSLGSPDQRREGLEAGANAYVVKREFDQHEFVEMIARFVGR